MLFVLWKRLSTRSGVPAADTQGMVLLQNQLQELTRAMESKLGEGTTRMFDSMKTQFDQSQRLMSSITAKFPNSSLK